MIRVHSVAAAFAVALLLAGCSDQPGHGPPSEQELHTGDAYAGKGLPGRHLYRCDDGRALLVDFQDQGLTIELRRSAGGTPLVLRAAAQGSQFVGHRTKATLLDNKIVIGASNRKPVFCKKENIG